MKPRMRKLSESLWMCGTCDSVGFGIGPDYAMRAYLSEVDNPGVTMRPRAASAMQLAGAARDCLSDDSWRRFLSACERANIPGPIYRYLNQSGEAFISRAVLLMMSVEDAHQRLWSGAIPKIIKFDTEFPVRRGRIDLLMFHEDGSATVCEIKDGSAGWRSVVAGIGQVLSYAVQIGIDNCALTGMKKALIYSSTQSTGDDRIIHEACLQAGVIPLMVGTEAQHRKASLDYLFGTLEHDNLEKANQHG